MPKFLIQHSTRYLYDEPVRDSANQIMLYPIADSWQEVIKQVIDITGGPIVSIHQDFFGNQVGTFAWSQPHTEMLIQSRVSVETFARELPPEYQPAE